MKSGVYFAVILVVVVIGAVFLLVFLPEKEGDTYLYFNVESDLPDPSVYLQYANGSTPVYEVSSNRSYSIVFTLTSAELEPTTYVYRVLSDYVNQSAEVILNPKQSKTVSLILSPSNGKWKLNSTSVSKNSTSLDIVKNSWLAGKKEVQLFVRSDGLPILIEENYHLPLSSDLTEFGEVYHMNLSLEELRSQPFEKSYTSEVSSKFSRTVDTTSVRLSRVGDTLTASSEVRTDFYVSPVRTFLVEVHKKPSQFDPESGGEFVRTVVFQFQVV
ncbi:MAG: hypothetical protein V1921_08035 [Candidatus Altiarchaeota archaeon]